LDNREVYFYCDVLSQKNKIQTFADLRTQILYFQKAETLRAETKKHCGKEYESKTLERLNEALWRER
jgi:hypothetical protein